MKKSDSTIGGVALIFLAIVSFLWEGLKIVGIIIAALAGIALLVVLIQVIIESIYFNSKKFLNLKEALNKNTEDCNELNNHIQELKSNYDEYTSNDYGSADYSDNSTYHYKRPKLNQIQNNSANEYHCSLSVCKNAQNQPFKYLCKYFSIPADENTLNKFEAMLNNFSAAEEGKQILLKEREEIIYNNKNQIPFTIRKYRLNKFFEKLGYFPIDISDSHFPKYSFKYISAGGNSGMTCDIVLNLENLERFVSYLYTQVELSKTIKYQRALMTDKLRTEIKERDNYTCQKCGISVEQEPHLLLEIDHIIPVSKNGKTTLDNLQTLCWKCNRQKSNKLTN